MCHHDSSQSAEILQECQRLLAATEAERFAAERSAAEAVGVAEAAINRAKDVLRRNVLL